MARTASEAVKEVQKGLMKSLNPDGFNPSLGDLRYRVESTIYIFSTAMRDFYFSSDLFPGLTLRDARMGSVTFWLQPYPIPYRSHRPI